MRNALALVVLLALIAVPAFAEEGTIPRATLVSLGLGDLQTMSDAEGMQVRGQATFFSRVTGTSVILGQLWDYTEPPPGGTVFAQFSASHSVNTQSTSAGTIMATHTVSASGWVSPFGSITGTVFGFGTVTVGP
jgi:hypothetical protein